MSELYARPPERNRLHWGVGIRVERKCYAFPASRCRRMGRRGRVKSRFKFMGRDFLNERTLHSAAGKERAALGSWRKGRTEMLRISCLSM